MKKRRVVGLFAAAAMCLALSGCGNNQIPEITGDQLQAIGEYVAITWMKYDAGNRSRLVELSSEPAPAPAPVQPEQPEAPEQSEQPEGMRPTEDTPVVSEPESWSMEEVMGVPEGILIEYLDYELCDVYPYDQEDSFFAISAVEGRKLLVLHFSMRNESGQDQEVNLLAQETTYQIIVNDTSNRRAMMTWLPDDMATYKDTIPADTAVPVVLVFEVEETAPEEITTVSLRLKNDSKIYTIQVF